MKLFLTSFKDHEVVENRSQGSSACFRNQRSLSIKSLKRKSRLQCFRLLENTESLERSSRKLDQGQEILAETESIGASVLNDLEHQKEVLFRSRNRVRPGFEPATLYCWKPTSPSHLMVKCSQLRVWFFILTKTSKVRKLNRLLI